MSLGKMGAPRPKQLMGKNLFLKVSFYETHFKNTCKSFTVIYMYLFVIIKPNRVNKAEISCPSLVITELSIEYYFLKYKLRLSVSLSTDMRSHFQLQFVKPWVSVSYREVKPLGSDASQFSVLYLVSQ